MKLRDFVPPVVAAGYDRFVAKSFSALAASFIHGEDVHDHQGNRLSLPFKQSAWVHAAVNHVAGEIASRQLCFYQGEQPYSEAAFDAFWAAPALGPKTAGARQPRLNRADVQRDLASWAKMEGEFFVCFDDSWTLAGLKRNPAALSPFLIPRPDRMRVIVTAGVLEGWEYIDPAGKRVIFLPEQVIHWKAFNPYDDWRGLGDYQAAKVATEGAFLTGTYIRDLMRNNGDQGTIVIGKSGPATPEQKEQIVADLRAKRRALLAGRPMDLFFTGDITVDRPKEQSAGADVMASKALSHQEIFVAFGIPPSMAEVKASYSVGKDSDYYQLIIRTCMPLGGQIAGVFAAVGGLMTGRTLSAEFEWDDHPVMVEVRNSRIETGLKLWGTGMAWKDINPYLDLGMEQFRGWDIGYLPFSVSPVDSGSEPVVDPTLAETPAAEADGKARDLPEISTLKLLVAARARFEQAKNVTPASPAVIEIDVLRAFSCGCDAHRAPVTEKGYTTQKADRPPEEIARWKDFMRQRRESVKSFSSAFGRVLMRARIQTLKKIESRYVPAAKSAQLLTADSSPLTTKTAAADLLFDLADFANVFKSTMRKQQQAALDKSGQQLFNELGKDDPFSFAPPEVQAFLSKRDNKLSSVPHDIFERIRATLQEGIDAGDSTDDLASRVKAEFNSLGDTQAMRIAQTETSAAYGYGRQEAMFKAGVKFKAWLTSGNGNVREAHQEAGLSYPIDGGIPLDEPFIVDGEELMHPGDSDGSPGNVINCHCVSIAVEAPADL